MKIRYLLLVLLPVCLLVGGCYQQTAAGETAVSSVATVPASAASDTEPKNGSLPETTVSATAAMAPVPATGASVPAADEVIPAQPAVGGSTSCIHTQFYKEEELDSSYHSIDGLLIQYVGAERFRSWVAQREAEKEPSGECPFEHITIVRFVEDFQIPREVFEFLCDNALGLTYDYDPDAIYGGAEKAERYYTSDRLQPLLEKRLLRLFKSKLLAYVRSAGADAFSAWLEAVNRTEWGSSALSRTHTELPGYGFTDEFRGNPCQVSCRKLITAFRIPRWTAEQLLAESRAAYKDCARTIDLGLLYSDTDPAADDSALFVNVLAK